MNDVLMIIFGVMGLGFFVVGAAFASAVSTLIIITLRFIFIYKKFGMHPFNNKFILVIFAGMLAYGASYLMPKLGYLVIDIAARSSIIIAIFGTLVIKLKISEDINNLVMKVWTIFTEKLK